MASQPSQTPQSQEKPPSNPLNRPLPRILAAIIALSCFYILGSYSNASSYPTLPLRQSLSPPCLQFQLNFTTQNQFSTSLDFEPHHLLSLPQDPTFSSQQVFNFCPQNFTHCLPCHDEAREKKLISDAGRFFHRERHCPEEDGERVRCLIPKPRGYKRPLPWPKSRDSIWFSNVPFKMLTEYKKDQNWVRLEGDKLVFPGGGTSFRNGVKGYVEEIIQRVLPLKSGKIRTLDVGKYLLDQDPWCSLLRQHFPSESIHLMSIAPRDVHEAQVQFALERGLPAMLGILSTYRLSYPSRSFDMVHCSRCLVPWTNHDGLYLLEIDRILRPGGYWVLSGPPISWKISYKSWEKEAKDLHNEQMRLEDLARRLCWKKIAEKGATAVWRKPDNHVHCMQKLRAFKSLQFCNSTDPDSGWYRTMEPCITRLPNVEDPHDISGGGIEKWPKRLNAIPPRIKRKSIEGLTVESFSEENQVWGKRISYYQVILKSHFTSRYRNIMDMNAGIGGFAAALVKFPVWVMNVVPHDAKRNTLGVIYERGLIGTYMNWCEAFSTYPRTYDLVHAYGLFGIYMNKCDATDILLEIYRIVRPEGAVIIRDHVDIIVKLKSITDRMRWNGRILHSESGPFHTEKILLLDNSA